MSGDISTPAARLLRSVVPIVPWIYIYHTRYTLYKYTRGHEAIVRFEASIRHEKRSSFVARSLRNRSKFDASK